MLNFDVTKKCLVGEGWCPIFAKIKVLIYDVIYVSGYLFIVSISVLYNIIAMYLLLTP